MTGLGSDIVASSRGAPSVAWSASMCTSSFRGKVGEVNCTGLGALYAASSTDIETSFLGILGLVLRTAEEA